MELPEDYFLLFSINDFPRRFRSAKTVKILIDIF